MQLRPESQGLVANSTPIAWKTPSGRKLPRGASRTIVFAGRGRNGIDEPPDQRDVIRIAMPRDGDVPRGFGRASSRKRTPAR